MPAYNRQNREMEGHAERESEGAVVVTTSESKAAASEGPLLHRCAWLQGGDG
jgi:hypothetical protein